MSEPVRDVLEDFRVLHCAEEIALIPRRPFDDILSRNVEAALIATSLGLSSIDYAKKKYCRFKPNTDAAEESILKPRYIQAYKLAKQHFVTLVSRLSTEGRPLASNGVFGAALVLERLRYSFFSAHLLYTLGHRYEGHAVSRLILEQIAWAHSAYQLEKIDDIERIVTTRAISKMKKTVPQCAKLYGFLSKKTHIDYKSHFEFLRVKEKRNVVLLAQSDYYEYAFVILSLADLFGIVWELSQVEYLTKVESVEVQNGSYSIREDRPFLSILKKHLGELESAVNDSFKSDPQ